MSHMQICLRDLFGAGEIFGDIASLEVWEGLSSKFRGEESRTFHMTTEWQRGELGLACGLRCHGSLCSRIEQKS